MAEQYANLCTTTLAANYTAADGTCTVGTTGSPWPSLYPFHSYVVGTDDIVKVIFKITGTATTSGATRFLVTAEGADANALASSTMRLALTSAAMDQIRADDKAAAQSGAFIYCADSTSTNTYVATVTPTLGAYTSGMIVTFKPTIANTGAATLNINGLGAISITAANNSNSALQADDLIAGGVYQLEYDGTRFRKITGPSTSWTTLTGSNGWGTNTVSFQQPQYCKDNFGTVYCRGLFASSGTATNANQTMATFPTGYRPIAQDYFVACTDSTVLKRIDVLTSGVLQYTTGAAGAFIDISQIQFSIYT